MQQPNERVAGQDVEVDVRQRLQLLHVRRGSDKGEEEAALGDLRCLLHDVDAEEVVSDDSLLDPVLERRVLDLGFLEILTQTAVVDELDLADHRRVDVEKRLQGGYQERSRAARRVEDRKARQNLLEQLAAEARVEPQE